MPYDTRAPRTDPPAPHSQTLHRGLQVLEVVADSPQPMTIADISGRTDLHRSIVYRILRTLEDHLLVSRNGDGQFEPGSGLAMLARSVQRTLQDAALPVLSELANEVGMTAFLVVPDHGEAVTITSVEPRQGNAHIAYRPGLRHPLDRGAPGLAILAGGKARAGERTEITEARRQGWVYSRGEVLAGMSSVAAPIIDRADIVQGAVAVVFVDDAANLGNLGVRLNAAAAAVVAELR